MTGYYYPVFMPIPSDGDSNLMSLPTTKYPTPSAEDLYFMTLLETGCPVLSVEDLHFMTPLATETEYPFTAEDLTVNHNYIGEGIQTQIDWMDIDSGSIGIEISIDWMDVDSTGAENCVDKEVSWVFSRISHQMFWAMVEKIGSDYLREIEERELLGNGAKKKKNRSGRDHVHFDGLDSCSKSCGYQQPLPQSIRHGQPRSHHQSTGDHQPGGHSHQRPSRGRNGKRNNGISPNPPDRGNKPRSPGNRPQFGRNNHSHFDGNNPRLTGRNNHRSHHLSGGK